MHSDPPSPAGSPGPAGTPDDGPVPVGEEFVQLFTRTQRSLFLFVLAQVGRPGDAEEILQETNVVVWTKWRDFRPGTNFLAWACRIASYEVLKFREKRRRDRQLFGTEFVDAVARDWPLRADDVDARRNALAECLQKLRPKDRDLIRRRYAPGASGMLLAEESGRPKNSIYQSLGRIRRALHECIRRRLSAEGLT